MSIYINPENMAFAMSRLSKIYVGKSMHDHQYDVCLL